MRPGQFILFVWSIVSLAKRNQINQKDQMTQIPASPSDRPTAVRDADRPTSLFCPARASVSSPSSTEFPVAHFQHHQHQPCLTSS